MISLLIALFIAATFVQIYFWWMQLGGLSRYHQDEKTQRKDLPAVAVLIAARNEEEHLRKHLPMWINQEYPQFTIYIIDDHSHDGTYKVVENSRSTSVVMLPLPPQLHGKKRALAYGIEQIKEEWIITTDADCFPNSKKWLANMMPNHADSDIILGYSPYLNQSGSFLSSLIQYESWYIAIQYMSAAIFGRPYMGVGRNLAFKKSLFLQVDGYKNHLSIPGGDDDLFVSSLPENTRFSIVPDVSAWVWTYPKKSWFAYWQQKRRHLTTAPHYQFKTKFWLATIYLSQFSWYILLFILIISYPWMLIFLLVRGVCLLAFTHRPKDAQSLSPNFKLSLIYDFILCMFYTGLSLTFLFPKRGW